MASNALSGSAGGNRRRRPWPFEAIAYLPHLENGAAIKQNLEAFEASFLSESTAVRVVTINSAGACSDTVLDSDQLESHLEAGNENVGKFEIFFINRYLVKGDLPWPADSNKLRISKHAFQYLCSHFKIAPTFISAIANVHQPSGRGCPHPSRNPEAALDFWLLLPIRVQVQCSDKRTSHTSSSGGKSQMNPLNYLHLAGPQVDIRGSQIAIYFLYNVENDLSSTIVVNFQDGRWRRVVEEPIMRVKEALEDGHKNGSRRDPFAIQAVFLTSALRWWNNALNSFNDQLIAYEEQLLREDSSRNVLSKLSSETNRALHCMAAHLHRYGSELALLAETTEDLTQYHKDSHHTLVARGFRPAGAFESVCRGLAQITTLLSSISRFRDELQLKTDNILALLVDNAQAANDKLLVQNGQAMQAILQATQAEAELARAMANQSRQLTEDMKKILQATHAETEMSRQVALQSQRLSEEMKRDSVAMKTIALLTTFFLPGTSFAAILSMPFFTESRWMQSVDRFWIWVSLTAPSTILCFVFYTFWSRSESKRRIKYNGEEMANFSGGHVGQSN